MSYSTFFHAMIEAAKAAYDDKPETQGMTRCVIVPDGDGFDFKFVHETRYAYLEHDAKYIAKIIHLEDGKKSLSSWQKVTAQTAYDNTQIDNPALRAALELFFEDDEENEK